MRELGEKFYFTPVIPKEKSGYRLSDMSLINASWRLEREFAQGVRGGRTGFYAWDWDGIFGYPHVPSGMKLPIDEPHNISNRNGVMAWHINAETCLAFWADNHIDCSNCIRTCPFNKPAGRLHDWVRRGIRYTPWLNELFLWGDDLLGYGKKQNPDDFYKK